MLWLLDGRRMGPFPKSVQTLSGSVVPGIFPLIAPSLGLERFIGRAVANVGSLARFSGMIAGARLTSAAPQPGLGFEPDVIAALFIGGAGTVVGGTGLRHGAGTTASS